MPIDDSETFQITVGEEWYVSPNGYNGSPGTYGTHDLPFKTLAYAISVASAGDTIYMMAGTYVAPITITKSGLTIRNHATEQAILDGSTSGTFMVEFNTGVNHTTFYGLTFKNTANGCVRLYKSNDYITFSYDTFQNIPRGTILAYNVDGAPNDYIEYLNINNCLIDNVGHASGFMGECVSMGGCRNFTYENNVLQNFTKQGLHNGAGTCNGVIQGNVFDNVDYFSYKIDPAYAVTNGDHSVHDIIVRNNLFTGTGLTDILFNPENPNSQNIPCQVYDIDIYNNVFNTTAPAFKIGANAPNCTFDNIRLMYNTFYVSDSDYDMAMSTTNGSTYSGCVIANNILVNSNSYQIINSASTGWTYNSNHFYRLGGTASGIVGVGLGTEGTQGNPLFVNIGSDFHLTGSSPCKNTASSAYTVADDYDGTIRPKGAGYDRGAYEFIE